MIQLVARKRLLLLSFLLTALLLSACNHQVAVAPAPPDATPYDAVDAAKRKVKFDTIKLKTPTPAPVPPPQGGGCQYHVWANTCDTCCAGVCVDADAPQRQVINPGKTGYNGEPYWCDAKPIIYLYPQVPTIVDVVLQVPGAVVESDPMYPQEGWQDIVALPGGKLIYKGQTYSELFYEAAITPTDEPAQGFVVTRDNLTSTLDLLLTALGYLPHERQDFLAYWAPKLRDSNNPYWLISVFDQPTKQRIDAVIIIPKPDTFIEHIFYFKPLSSMKDIPPLTLPHRPPVRNGFTAVEWGGIIDRD